MQFWERPKKMSCVLVFYVFELASIVFKKQMFQKCCPFVTLFLFHIFFIWVWVLLLLCITFHFLLIFLWKWTCRKIFQILKDVIFFCFFIFFSWNLCMIWFHVFLFYLTTKAFYLYLKLSLSCQLFGSNLFSRKKVKKISNVTSRHM